MNISDHHPIEHRKDAQYGSPGIHPEGLYRWKEFADRIPFSRETWRKRVLIGAAPAPIRISGACTAWKGAAILEWLKDPNGYRRPDNGEENPPSD